jgi:hypothetical protein
MTGSGEKVGRPPGEQEEIRERLTSKLTGVFVKSAETQAHPDLLNEATFSKDPRRIPAYLKG